MMQRLQRSEPGQVLVIFAGAFVVIVMMLALLFDGARGLAQRREMQNASDAAAMAGANLFKGLDPAGCSQLEGNASGPPQAEVVAAIQNSVAANLPWYDPNDIVVTCLTGWDNVAVSVDLHASSETFFGAIFGGDPLKVSTHSAAVNGGVDRNAYSVILLDDGNPSWPNSRRGCPSMLFSGGPTVIFDSSIYIDSDCLEVDGGALSTNGNATTLQLGSSGPRIRIAGEYKPQALTITPEPLEFQAYRPDPLIKVMPPPVTPIGDAASLSVRSATKKVVGVGNASGTVVLEPGVYVGGIELRNSSVAYLRPGIYVMYGGGLKLGAQTSVYSVDESVKKPGDFKTWSLSCTNQCGLMIYNTGTQSGANAMDEVTVAAGATFKVLNYDSAIADSTMLGSGTHYANAAYDNMLIWQARTPASDASWAQPEIHLNGGGNVSMTGTVYGPSAKVLMGGTSGGSGGGGANLVLQFVVWDMEISGNATFHFVYDGDEVVKPPDYGLVE